MLNVFEQPLENFNVTMDWYVNVIWASSLCQVLLEVFHVAYQEILLAPKIFTHFPILVKYMYRDVVSIV